MKWLLPVLALLAAPAAARDVRLATRLYDPEAVVRIEGHVGVQATLEFGADEHIENVAIGDAASWQVTPNKRANLLFIKPLAARARTNLTVVTDRRSYFFDLVAGPSARAVYLLRFTYPPEPKREDAASLPAPALSEEEAKLAAGTPPVDPARLNFAWRPRGKAALLPTRVYDDGTATYLAWAPGRSVPAILIRDSKGTEGPVNYAVRGEMIVIDGVPAAIVLRAGRESATLDYAGPPAPALAAKGQ